MDPTLQQAATTEMDSGTTNPGKSKADVPNPARTDRPLKLRRHLLQATEGVLASGNSPTHPIEASGHTVSHCSTSPARRGSPRELPLLVTLKPVRCRDDPVDGATSGGSLEPRPFLHQPVTLGIASVWVEVGSAQRPTTRSPNSTTDGPETEGLHVHAAHAELDSRVDPVVVGRCLRSTRDLTLVNQELEGIPDPSVSPEGALNLK